MSFGISTLVGVCLFILPGVLMIQGMETKKGNPPSFGVNRDIFRSVLFSILIHALILLFIYLIPDLPQVDYANLYQILTGTGEDQAPKIVADSVAFFGEYLFVLYFGSYFLGRMWGHVSRFWKFLVVRFGWLPLGSTDFSGRASSGTDGVWSVLDVLTHSGILYRGFYHSSSAGDAFCAEPTLDMMLVSRWSKGNPGNPNERPVRDPGFKVIPSYVTVEEVHDILLGGALAPEDPEVVEVVDTIVSSPEELDKFLTYWKYTQPEFHIFWKEIQNINVRNIDLRGEIESLDEDAP